VIKISFQICIIGRLIIALMQLLTDHREHRVSTYPRSYQSYFKKLVIFFWGGKWISGVGKFPPPEAAGYNTNSRNVGCVHLFGWQVSLSATCQPKLPNVVKYFTPNPVSQSYFNNIWRHFIFFKNYLVSIFFLVVPKIYQHPAFNYWLHIKLLLTWTCDIVDTRTSGKLGLYGGIKSGNPAAVPLRLLGVSFHMLMQ